MKLLAVNRLCAPRSELSINLGHRVVCVQEDLGMDEDSELRNVAGKRTVFTVHAAQSLPNSRINCLSLSPAFFFTLIRSSGVNPSKALGNPNAILANSNSETLKNSSCCSTIVSFLSVKRILMK